MWQQASVIDLLPRKLYFVIFFVHPFTIHKLLEFNLHF